MGEANNNKIKLAHAGVLILWAFTMGLPTAFANAFMGMVLFVFILRCVVVRDIKLKKSLVLLALLIFFAACLLSMLNSLNLKDSLKGLNKVWRNIAIIAVLMHSVGDKKLFRKIALALLLGAVFVCLDGIYQYFIGKDLFGQNPVVISLGLKRLSATFSGTNDFGVYLVTLAPLAWVLSLYYFKSRAKIFWLLSSIFLTLCLLLTFGRGSFLGLMVASLVFILVKKDKLLITAFCLFLVALPFLIPGSVKNWVRVDKSPLVVLANEDRIIMYKTAIKMIEAHPVIGVGVNTFVTNYPNYKVSEFGIVTPDKSYAHNSFLQMGAELGFLGLAIFAWLLYAFFKECRFAYKRQKDNFIKNSVLGLACGVIGFLLNGLTESNLYYSRLSILFWFVVGLALSAKFIGESE
jgi:O-antigen ligase